MGRAYPENYGLALSPVMSSRAKPERLRALQHHQNQACRAPRQDFGKALVTHFMAEYGHTLVECICSSFAVL
jgi:hypothetical protein